MPPIVLIEMVEEVVTVIPSFCQVMLVGEPEAVQVKVAVDPNINVTAVGCWVMVGGVGTARRDREREGAIKKE